MKMKLARLLSTSALSLSVLLGTSSLIYSQEQHEDAKPQEETRPEASKPAQDEAKPEKQNQDKPARNDEKPVKQEDSKGAKQSADNRGGRIPDDKFRAHFGRQHTFVVNHPTVVGGQPRFQYGGYSFVIVDAWPVGWAYTDQCYIDYIDGQYFLFDLLHPGVQIALTVVM